MLGSSDIICSQATFSNSEIDSNRNTWTTRTWTGSTETHQRRAKQGDVNRTAEPTHNHGIWGITFITKKRGKTSISYCSKFSYAPWRREHKRSKTAPLHLLYTLLINSTFFTLMSSKCCCWTRREVALNKCIEHSNIKKEWWWWQFQKPAALISTLVSSSCIADL